MESFTPNIWFPVVTLVAGVVLKAIFDLFNERRQEQRERRARFEKRQEIFLMQKIDAQRVLLPLLQESLVELMRATAILHSEDVKLARTGEWKKGYVPDEVSEAVMLAFRKVGLYRVRVHDDELRDEILHLTALCSNAGDAGSYEEANQLLYRAGVMYSNVNERLGQAIRSLDAQEQAIIR